MLDSIKVSDKPQVLPVDNCGSTGRVSAAFKPGAEVYGGLGDTELGLTRDPDVTHQYAGINLRADLQNHVHVIVGGAFGLTEDSEDTLLRLLRVVALVRSHRTSLSLRGEVWLRANL